MITDERITAYIHSLDSGDGILCDEIAREAAGSCVPIIRRETAALLKAMVALKQPKNILEVGTAVGYSALLMARVIPETAHITTIEKFEKRIPIARENFRRAGAEDRITLLEGDAGEILAGLSGNFDFIFMDAAKGQYLNWLPDIVRLLPAGGLLMSDNVLQGGSLVESRYAVERRDRTIHARMREYLYALTHMEEFETSVVPIGDGVALSVRRERNRNEKDGASASCGEPGCFKDGGHLRG